MGDVHELRAELYDPRAACCRRPRATTTRRSRSRTPLNSCPGVVGRFDTVRIQPSSSSMPTSEGTAGAWPQLSRRSLRAIDGTECSGWRYISLARHSTQPYPIDGCPPVAPGHTPHQVTGAARALLTHWQPRAHSAVVELLEREAVLEQLDRFLDEVIQNEGRLVLVAGEAGIFRFRFHDADCRSRWQRPDAGWCGACGQVPRSSRGVHSPGTPRCRHGRRHC
jgi:hypothetical protein